MTVKKFKLLSEARQAEVSLDIGLGEEIENIQAAISEALGIVEPSGIGFRDNEHNELTDINEIQDCRDDIQVTIDGHAVRYPQGPKGLPVVGTFYETFPDHLGNHQRMFQQYGNVIRTFDNEKTVYMTNDPKIVSIILSESQYFTKLINQNHPLAGIKNQEAGLFLADTDAPTWKIAHKFITPAFTPKAIRHYTPIFNNVISKAFDVFDEFDEKDEAFNVYPYMMKLGSQAIGMFAFNLDFHHFDSAESEMHALPKLIAQHLTLNKKVSSKAAWYAHLPFGDAKHLKEVKQKLNKVIGETAKDAAASGNGDLPLQDAAEQASCIVDYINRATDPDGNKIPHEMVVPLLAVTAGAGFATTSSLLSWVLYCCVTWPEYQERLLQEYVDHGIKMDTEVDWDLIQSMQFQTDFIKEVQRLHNPSYQPARTARRDVILPGGFSLPKDAVVIAALHHIHNNAEVWENPTKFEPDRWSDPEIKKKPKGSYIPFAAGPRQCIGFNFALTEVKTFLPRLLYRYKFELASDDPVEYDPMFQLIRPMNLYVRAKRRTEWPNPTIHKVSAHEQLVNGETQSGK